MENVIHLPTPLQRVHATLWDERHISVWIKRDDLAHPVVSGNKIRKLAYLLPVLASGLCPGVISFGGAHSNHIHALAWLCKEYGVPLVLFVRSHAPVSEDEASPTVRDVLRWGAEVQYLSPTAYRLKTNSDQLTLLKKKFQGWEIVPEGGSHFSALEGVKTMMAEVTTELSDPDVWICPVGTGATFAGIVRSKHPEQFALGVSALKASALDEAIGDHWHLADFPRWVIAQQWHFGGYGKVPKRLQYFLDEFLAAHGILLDPLYNGKAMYAFCQYVKSGLIPSGSKVIFLHTGGLQGWRQSTVMPY